MCSLHPIFPQENVAIVNSSSISNQNDEFDFLKTTTKKVTLAKDTKRLLKKQLKLMQKMMRIG